jgi:uncharacterized protein (TIGR04222 family)
MSSDLLRRVEEFAIDGPEPPALPFAARLARENGWPRAYADRVIREYKRFAYLAMTAGHPVCPSEDVDQAWHLHLTYTHSYWKRFCGDVLGQPLHHNPTRGGSAEGDKHRRMYAETLTAYRRAFGHEPPADVWPGVDERFAPDRHERVDRAANWVVPKRAMRRGAATASLVVASLVFATGCGNLDPFELNGAWYLAFLVPTMVAAFVLGIVLRNRLKKPHPEPGDEAPDPTWEQAAYLVGGAGRVFSAALARLTRDGYVEVDADRVVATGRGVDGLCPSELAVLGSTPLRKTDKVGLKAARERVEAAAGDTAEGLRAAGLLLTPEQARTAAYASAMPPVLVWLVFGLPRLGLGIVNDRPVWYLIVVLVAFGIAAVLLAVIRPTRSRKGDDALAKVRTRQALLKYANTREAGSDLPLAVALFGTAALAGSELAELQSWYPKQTENAATGGGCGSGCGPGCGGGGGCGGGCGGGGSGCGGCGGGGGD